ncbi:hypothetical protein [Glycomyces harbinensis]|uniref:Uncharacterized protein n=1 Tax=Glycomyces harbinensis TaxID=58114 RepID=A0A1G7C126_9ACTN|nr:hypothetical protein [Glycomyces harbinensis]SDE33048.1 hypothetical protein SAMN05216270_11891 [Glycomyces harbinensis]
MLELNPSLWDEIDLPMLHRIVALFDRSGPFNADLLAQQFRIDLEPREIAFSAKRLADHGYIESQNRAGGFPHTITSISDKARQTLAGRPAPRADASAPSFDELIPQLDDLMTKVTSALRANPSHPEAPRWRNLVAAATDIRVALSA